MLRLHLIRHGQTECSVRGRMCGRAHDPPLSEQGQAMAQAIATGLAHLPLTAIVTSPLQRARDTADPLAQRLFLTPYRDADFAEIDLGEWEGLTPQEIEARSPEQALAWKENPKDVAPPQGETALELNERVTHAVSRWQKRYPSGEILVVAHKTVLRVLLCQALGIDIANFKRRLAQPLGGHSILELDHERGAFLRLLGSLAHLPRELHDLKG